MRRNRLFGAATLLALTLVTAAGCDDDPTAPAVDRELASVRAATDDFSTIEAALAAGYADIDVVMQNMGYHYLNGDLLDATFDIDHPEILVYAPDAGGTMRLVAVEYAVPLALSENAPEGFTGDDDAWDRNETFGLWTLHAWVHLDNPNGVFSATNASVVLPQAAPPHAH